MDMTPEEVRDAKMRAKAGKAYDRALTSTEAAPAPKAPASGSKRPAWADQAAQEAKDAEARKKITGMGYAKGGKVGSASLRADGIAQRGKTRGTML